MNVSKPKQSINFNKLSHEYDPLGMIYDAVQSSLIYYNIPKSLSLIICSYLSYIESTIEGYEKPAVCTYSPGKYAYELCVLINTPNETALPHDVYILTDIIFPFRGPMHRQSEYYAGIQLFDDNNYQEPGKGNIIYQSDVMDSYSVDVENKTEKMCELLSINIPLKCNQTYLFFIKQTEYVNLNGPGLNIRLVDALNGKNRSVLKKLKFCTTVFWYPSKQYEQTKGYVNFFQICFRCKG
eukprot:475864_1